MAKVAVRVSTDARDMLAAVAASRRTTMSVLLEEAARRLEREEEMRQATLDYERFVGDDPDGFADYLAEGHLWDTTSGDGLTAAPGVALPAALAVAERWVARFTSGTGIG
ncbi:hypothetical protein Daura_08455 [Dactylosporangium aurantiacum]|uniref:Ribbon-helix-helix protein CopG domain-containing protein n=1 Tax=Dactylosporangium aurantiacum TaxID=35754 RepID=A0A9Q9ILT9_9ACTN|nr:hypothetical protein [Dactylosporangium aurantiacum]MDG6104592.1 hypothetical protein [Dactylosporangium aurantiacum]UWZ56197.1 hypothetical protein Daura_08455 [Dactylosporangium aurantiacum]